MVGGEVVYIADEIDFGNGAEAKFPNNGTVSKTLNRRSVGGLQGRDLSQEGKRAAQVLQPRGVCRHSHKH